MTTTYKKILFFILMALCFTSYISAPLALAVGIAFAVFAGNPYAQESSKTVKYLLKIAIVGLGFGMNFYNAVKAGKEGLLFTISTIVLVLSLGYLLGKILKINPKTSYLISSGTAICGGSAIAAVAPITGASQKQISVALGTVFTLNALALLLFPAIGHFIGLTQYQFGLWSAIAIHDTSSVVGAASAYGDEALQVATTVKLGRALWIIPLSLLTVAINKNSTGKIAIPYFILLFIVAMIVSTMLPQYQDVYGWITFAAKKALTVTLFLIGTGLSLDTIKAVGFKVFLQGVLLWIAISILSLVTITLIY
ncbi:putative sulfate exporter family transporter [Flavobacterium salilacus subsp. salilacus]|uniref:YeiH family protein n=1 Tax=Flavobacterium TaxID=237 RepID=UPI00107588E0|nr:MULTISPECIES: putative sulfate exporter family transporter [Flavobacterium]KAF2519139.1 putative sulfate exporter family transporter [Flavobacterium salilacus subsp. salilacus]MBE1613318.1 putative sulfate exporter family transporter [Flavobacterium sp. SaA2.13]